MKDLRTAIVQLNFHHTNSVDRNIAKIGEWTERAAGEGAQLIVFGELCVSGYLLDTTGMRGAGSGSSEHYRRAEPVPGQAIEKLTAIAARYGVHIAAGMGDLQAGVVYNAYFIVGPDGYVGKQRKLHMPVPEYRYYATGSKFRVFDIGSCNVGISICFDNWFPETSRISALMGAEVLLAPWMWIVRNETPEIREDAVRERKYTLSKMFRARAMDNAMYVLVVDHVGFEAEGFEFGGVSLAFDPWGELIGETKPFVEDMLVVDLKAAEIEKYRTYGHLNTLQYRRPELYGALTQMPDG